MDQVKIGKFIAACRKQKQITQAQLAELLGITDRAVSKWETGKAMPDTSIMLDMCHILGITVNDLLNGEVLAMEQYNEKSEQMLLELAKEKIAADKRLLTMEVVTGILLAFVMLASMVLAVHLPIEEWLQGVIILIGLLPILIATPFMLRIEQIAGYYQCGQCSHQYIPSYKQVFFAAHVNRTRYMKCPKCGKRSWQKKFLTKE